MRSCQTVTMYREHMGDTEVLEYVDEMGLEARGSYCTEADVGVRMVGVPDKHLVDIAVERGVHMSAGPVFIWRKGHGAGSVAGI